MMKTATSKQAVRERIWDRLERERIARFPLPPHGRIPNFAGAEEAARRLVQLPVFGLARVIKVNPDAPQLPVRRAALKAGKRILMPAPRLRSGFILLDPRKIGPSNLTAAASIAGAFRYGREVRLDALPRPDLIVVGSVAVAHDGARIGKGEGYSELEFAILRELRLADERTPIATTVHDIQVVNAIAVDPYDVFVDTIVTPTRVIQTPVKRRRPRGLLWNHITEAMVEEMPILALLERRRRPKA
jgi:5-formyltetrahydrofolate cyclo-ligase